TRVAAAVVARKGGRGELRRRVREGFGIELPEGPSRVAAGGVAFIGTGPGAWLVIADDEPAAVARALRDALAGVASVCDQSDGYAVFPINGPKARERLQKLVFIDLHDRVFKLGQAASTAAGHIGAILWRLDDAPDGTPAFEIAVYRSFAQSFEHALCAIMKE
ncbi:MAG: sarcosine oxidase subunit gamma, partial [Bacillota bacterium]